MGAVVVTDAGTLSTDVRALVQFGREQYEDAAIYHAVAQYVSGIGQIPSGAWGELPWSGRWQQRWEKGLDHRVREAHQMSEHTGEHAAAVLKAAADYTDTDIQVALNFDLRNEFLSPYLAAYSGTPKKTGVYRPGTGGPAPAYGYATAFRPPDSLDEFRTLNNERLPGGFTTCTAANPSGVDLETGVSSDSLDDFVSHYGHDLLCAEYVAAHYAPGAARPFSDHILPAWRCVPGIIRNRAELLQPAANTYQECADRMRQDIAQVRDQWQSPGAALAWFRQAMSHHSYLADIAVELEWFAEQGLAAASLLEGLRNKYAEHGHQRAKQIIELAKAVTHASADMLGGIGDCASNPVKQLTSALSGFLDVLYLELSQRHDQAIGLIGIDEQRRKEQGDPGTLAHDTLPFPEADQTLWSNGKQWTPNQGAGPAAPL